ncbi:MAG: hypothetical protein RLZZ28_621 [Bacteroidota bacterium]
MKQIVTILLFVPVLAFSQSKKKKRQAEEKANAEMVAKLTAHIRFLADDKLEGRRTGSKGEELAMQYIIDQYTQMGLEPKGTNGYMQTFDVNDGKQVEPESFVKAEARNLLLTEEYFPLAFSASKKISGSSAIALSEAGQPWFKDLKELLEENKANPHFDIEEEIKKMAAQFAAKNATALFIYNSSALTDNVLFNKKDSSKAVSIPVIYLTKKGIQHYFSDNSATWNIDVNIKISENHRTGKNIIGFINNHAANTVILGAHYDHLGYGEDKTALDTGHIIHNGADDNASGTAALIELTRMLKKQAPVNNNYLIMHFSGEELGLFGSKHWLDYPTTTITPNYMINMDMVGRYDTARKLTIGGYGTSPYWGEMFAAMKNNFSVKIDSSGSGPSDHAAFYRKDMPVLFFFTGSHSDYHKATDDWDKINYEGERDIVKLIYQIIEQTNMQPKLVFTKTRDTQGGGARKFKVSLGVIPDYGYSGTGMRIDGVSPGKLAEKTGLQAGDVLLQLGDIKFVDVNSYMEALGKFDKGDKVKLRIKRDKEEKVFDIVF